MKPNKIIYSDSNTTVLLLESKRHGNKETLVDTIMLPAIMKFRWGLNKQGNYFYARSGKGQLLHRFIKGNPDQIVDHKNRNTLDNRDGNLRKCSRTQNQANSSRSRNKCKYKGVSKDTRYAKVSYRAQLQCNGKKYFSKVLTTEKEAAKAYNLLAIQHFGEFAKINDVDENS